MAMASSLRETLASFYDLVRAGLTRAQKYRPMRSYSDDPIPSGKVVIIAAAEDVSSRMSAIQFYRDGKLVYEKPLDSSDGFPSQVSGPDPRSNDGKKQYHARYYYDHESSWMNINYRYIDEGGRFAQTSSRYVNSQVDVLTQNGRHIHNDDPRPLERAREEMMRVAGRLEYEFQDQDNVLKLRRIDVDPNFLFSPARRNRTGTYRKLMPIYGTTPA
jgi:hypothetical protein